ncbi:MAG: mRNA interferase MazF [Blastocatellia bacterium]|jgi:mRNA interferase MazF|nr:mRNA interferase MazF [Blastocatellia bacterium]
MTVSRGEIWLADLNPTQGSEQSGTRPVLIFQNDSINRFTSTFLTIPLTANLRRALLPTCVLVRQGDGGLDKDSVPLCHQLRALDKVRLKHRLGTVSKQTMAAIENRVLFTTGVA